MRSYAISIMCGHGSCAEVITLSTAGDDPAHIDSVVIYDILATIAGVLRWRPPAIGRPALCPKHWSTPT